MNRLLNDLKSVTIDYGDYGVRAANESEVTVKQTDEGNGIVLLNAEYPVFFIELTWSYQTPKDARTLGDTWERTYGDMQWLPLDPDRMNPWYVLAYKDGRTTGFGMCVGPNAIGAWKISPDSVTLILDVRNGGDGAQVQGRTIELCQFVSETYEGMSPYRACQAFCALMSPHPLLPDKPLYGGNNWYYAYGKSSREQILSDAKLQKELSEGLENRPFMVIDDGWEINHACGPWESNEKFGDMKSLADEIKAMGVRPGIWTRVLYTTDPMPECAHIHGKFLDPSDPKVLSYVRDLIDKICGWGFELIKHDYTAIDFFNGALDHMDRFPASDGWHFHDRTKTTAEIIKELYRTIYETAKGRAMILGCATVSFLGVGMMHAARTGDDTSGVDFKYTYRNGYNALGFKLMQNRTFFAADADCCGILPDTIPWETNGQWAEMLARSGSPFFISCAYDTLTPEQRKQMKGLYAIASVQKEDPEPEDWFENKRPVRYV